LTSSSFEAPESEAGRNPNLDLKLRPPVVAPGALVVTENCRFVGTEGSDTDSLGRNTHLHEIALHSDGAASP
jgi:hypothetical protein